MNIFTIMKSNLYKSFHTPVWIVHMVIPVCGMAVFVWYYSFSAMQEMDKVFTYIEVVAVMFPFLIGMITAMVSEIEQKAAGCQLFLSIPASKYIPHISQLIVLLGFGIVSSMIAVVGFGIGFTAMGYTIFSYKDYWITAVFLFFSMIPLCLFQYIVSFVWGKGYSMGIGITGSLLSALLLTGLGDDRWWMIPWGIAARFSLNSLIARSSRLGFLQYPEIIQSIVALVFFSFFMMIIFFFTFRNWEGKNKGG